MKNLICNEALLQHIRLNLERFEMQTHEQPGLKQATVAITIVDVSHDPGVYDLPFHESWANHGALILTKRAAKLRKHAGQWAFPGGQMDAGESPEETALREMEEEVGLKLNSDHIIGRLDDFTTRSGFIIKVVIVWGGPGLTLTPNSEEVQAIHRIPLAEFLREDAPILEQIPESSHPVLKMPVGNTWIAAPTAALIYQFREVALLGKATRVAHYEQPYFAWK